MVFVDGTICTDSLGEERPVFFKSRTIRSQCRGAIPTTEFTTHNQTGTVGINRRTIVENLPGDIERIDDHDDLAKDCERIYLSY